MFHLRMLFLLLICIAVAPVTAQDAPSALDWVPADFEGVLRVDLSRPNETLVQLNMAYYVASFLQPQRVTGTPQRGLNDYFPVDLFDTEGAAFETTVLPLLSGEFVIGYRTLGAGFAPDADDVLLVLPTDDAFAAAGILSAITRAQDLPERTQYAGATIFRGDQTAFAFTPSAVLVGDVPLLERALDTQAGQGARMSDDAAYAELTARLDGWPISAYLTGDASRHALGVLLAGDDSIQPVLEALGDALQPYNGDSLEAALLGGAVDSLAVGLRAEQVLGTVTARVVLQTGLETQPDAGRTPESTGVMAFIPRNAMLVQQGSDARGALADALVAAPTAGYFGQRLHDSFRAVQPGAQVVPTAVPPDAEDIGLVVDSLVAALASARGFDLDGDLTAHLAGDYALALLPRPNNPARGTGAPVDVLLVADTGAAAAAVDGVTALAQALLALDDGAFTDSEGAAGVRTLYGPVGGEPLLQVGALDDTLVVGTGEAVAAALRAGRGDNRLIDVTRWQNVSRDAAPTLYLDLNALLATFAPTAGAPVQSGIGQLGLSVQSGENGRYELNVIVTLPPAL